MPPKKPAAKPAAKAKKDEAAGQQAEPGQRKEGQGDNWEPSVEKIKPKGQVELSQAELEKEYTRVLSAKDPNAPQNITRFSFKERTFKLDAAVEQMFTHFEMEGCLVHRDTEEGKRLAQEREAEKSAAERAAEAVDLAMVAGESAAAQAEEDTKQLHNQFNFSERASQAFVKPLRDRETETEPPPSVNFGATATQWEIFDAYIEDLERQRVTKEKKQPVPAGKKDEKEQDREDEEAAAAAAKGDTDIVHSGHMSKSLKIMERMVNQNTYDEIAQDFKYWEDASDAFKEGEGTLLPLWKFYTEKAKKKHVTALCWNPEYRDLFVVGYGSYDFMRQGTGLICCWSLKNPSHPEYTFTTETGVMCLDFHPQHSSLLAVGLYDGTVMIFDIRNRVNKPIFASTVRTGKHTDPVWQVCWQEEDLAKNLNFFSISSDGRVTLWTMSKNELQFNDVMELKLVGLQREWDAEEETSLCGLAGGCCFDFNKHSEHLFVVGTEEGRIHKCSKAYNSQYLDTFEGHHMAVYTVRWNNFHPRIFLSASADWTVKLWDHNSRTPLMSFDLGNAVGDVAWSPYSSTVFAAVTNDGKVHVFDLAENKHEPMCDQKVVRKSKLTHVSFNPREPVLIVGDDKGSVNCLKLSPNLRKPTKPPESEEKKEDVRKPVKPVAKPAEVGTQAAEELAAAAKKKAIALEIDKLDRLLALADKTVEAPAA
mmetsp:Transcript_24088/g.57176  ORF Transcript_24088/g.57176 Transcript_24088/m.57176 type:complete len:706 (-) Transcript_24088:55-2172(-)